MNGDATPSPIAVVGLGGLFPQAPDLDTFQRNIQARHDASRPVPPGRWVLDPHDAYDPVLAVDKVYSTRACFVEDFTFDPAGLRLDSDTLRGLDPLYEMVLHVGRQAFHDFQRRHDAATGTLDRRRIGVTLAAIALPTDGASAITREVVGRAFEDALFRTQTADAGSTRGTATLGGVALSAPLNAHVTARPASLLAHALGLGGGSCTLDAACASSLCAVKLACDELRAGRTDAMLAGGVSRPESLYTQMGFSQLRALSPSGVCRPFDAGADGLVVGEGAGIVVLKRLDDARRDGDTIYGVIQGIGLSNDVAGSLLAADSEGQLRAMREAYRQAGWAPEDVDLIECHGTGTPLGDAVELTSLRALWHDSHWSPGQCALGSVKSNIGHLLTAAGAAGLIKTLLAIRDKQLPPSANVEEARTGTDLDGVQSPFHLQTEAQPWERRDAHTPRRAAVSAFGFGGINAHLLVEEAADVETAGEAGAARRPSHPRRTTSEVGNISSPLARVRDEDAVAAPVAIVGMDAHFGRLASLQVFQEAILRGETAVGPPPEARWRGCDDVATAAWGDRRPPGAYLDAASVDVGAFRLPPNEIPETLPQQLLMLQSVARALRDAGVPPKQTALRTGVIIGMGLDLNTTNFHHRWALLGEARQWSESLGLELDDQQLDEWVAALREESGPALTPGRVLGALGNVVASRIAREFAFGGPSFAISAEAASGIRALAVGVQGLRQCDMDTVVVGAVDLPGDVRAMLVTHTVRPFSSRGEVRPFDVAADGTLVGEGAATVVLKRLSDAVASGDRIYAVIRGLGFAGGSGPVPDRQTYRRALERAYADAHVAPGRVSYLETHGSGDPEEDRVEAEALSVFFSSGDSHSNGATCAIGSAKPTIGHTGAAAGLASLVKTAICLYQEIVPPLRGFRQPSAPDVWSAGPFHLPIRPHAWLRDRADGPRSAGVSVMTVDGGCAHVVLQGAEHQADGHAAERRQPLGGCAQAVFGVGGSEVADLLAGLDGLRTLVVGARGDPTGTGDHARHDGIEPLARRSYTQRVSRSNTGRLAVALFATDADDLHRAIAVAERSLRTDPSTAMDGRAGVFYTPQPLGPQGEVAFVFPGSGNHYVGMGAGIGVHWPHVFRRLDDETTRLRGQVLPDLFTPHRRDWGDGWRRSSDDAVNVDPLAPILGQVAHGVAMSDLLRGFGVHPTAAIGYSLGESTALFAMRAWRERDEMYARMRQSPLFQSELVGRCEAARRVWGLADSDTVDWRSVVVNRRAAAVRAALADVDHVYLLIVNAPGECVIGGQRGAVAAVVDVLDCEAVDLLGTSTVHCPIARSVEDAYRGLHLLATTPPTGVRFYSAAQAQSYPVDRASAADAIVAQAVSGFDFAATIEQAYTDGVRVFVEPGPQASCSRMIAKILHGRPHLARSACVKGEEDVTSVLRLVATLFAERVLVDLGPLYGHALVPLGRQVSDPAGARVAPIVVPTGGPTPRPRLPRRPGPPQRPVRVSVARSPVLVSAAPTASGGVREHARHSLVGAVAEASAAGAHAHEAFLRFSQSAVAGMGDVLAWQAQLVDVLGVADVPADRALTSQVPAYDRDLCLEFAVGSAAKVLGSEFAALDSYPVRVRLPDEPLMLVDRILTVEGAKGSMTSGRVVTEHDVRPGAWYLDGDRAPVCISVEAGQADLFLCSYLGIDLALQGTRSYRLLDATVTFHRGLPRSGDVVRYDIHIDRFVRQGDTYLFFFRFVGSIGGQPVVTMENGCAGFFTERETAESGGIVLTADDHAQQSGRRGNGWQELVPMVVESYDAGQLEALRGGNLSECFGPLFDRLGLREPMCLPGGRMHLIDRVVALDPTGGRFGLGSTRAEADIRGDEWFLTCHFVDDMVMPGTLMYECCVHTLRVLLMRMGWVTEQTGVCCEPVPGVSSRLRCRGPVTQATRVVTYEVQLKEVGYNPEPYAIADALVYADGQRIVQFTDMSLKLTGATREQIEATWRQAAVSPIVPASVTLVGGGTVPSGPRSALYDDDRILAFAVGRPSDAFGEAYCVFDVDRRIARLPGPPYKFLDRITEIHAEAWQLTPGGWIEAQYDVPPDGWYFLANRQSSMPFAIVLEIALQPCGWLAAYLGSALRSREDLSFRNLGGTATLYEEVFGGAGTLTVRVRITKVAEAGGMIVQSYDMQVWREGRIVYDGETQFGFFSSAALAQQVGIRDAADRLYVPDADETRRGRRFALETLAPLTPDDTRVAPADEEAALPARALRMIDDVELFVPDGGPHGLGFIRGVKQIDPREWFFTAHFYQDPVCPGSLGFESFLQLLKVVALERWGDLRQTHRFQPILIGRAHTWVYRGQIIPTNHRVEVDVVVTHIEDGPTPMVSGSGFLKVDGIPIYEMQDIGVRLVTTS